MTCARQFYQFPGELELWRGGVLERPTVAYETWGKLNAQRDNAVLIFTGLSPSAHAASSPADSASGWWEEIVGPHLPIDTNKFFVICINSLGSCFGSTGPASVNPATNEIYRLSFPVLMLEDVAAGGKAVIDSLGIESLYSVIGPSMGGMTALAYAAQYPDSARSLVLISTASRSLPYAIALRSLQREMIRNDPDWQGGEYKDAGPVQGMRLARKLGMITYRSGEEWVQRFGRERIPEEHPSGDSFAPDFEVEAYLEYHAQRFTGQFDANCYLYLSRASDLFDFAEHGSSMEVAARKIQAERILIVGVASDFLFRIERQRELASIFKAADKRVTLVELDSIQGHDSFLADMDSFRPVLDSFFTGDWSALTAMSSIQP
ncbi:MAG: homoserine O-acetyltransferase [Chromatiales bacterium]|nr:homoserine O-acetyltransferase [Chromatiales bacterium]